MLATRRGAPVALLVAASSVSLLFAATPFLIPEVAERYGVALGTAGLISALQVGGFAVVTFVAGRWWRARRSLLVVAAVVGGLADLASAVGSHFGLLLALRFVAGAAAGVMTWLAWAEAMRSGPSMRDVAAVGPVSALLAAPLLGWLAAWGGDRAVYLLLGAATLPVTLLPVRIQPSERRRGAAMSPSRSNLVLIAGLGVLTMAGSSLFVFVGALADREIAMEAVAVSLGYSLNALTGLIGARRLPRPARSWPWMVVIVASAGTLVAVPNPVVFYLSMAAWGFAFWMAVPGVLGAIADWSLVADERTGDAQAVMALGRAVGPAVGGILVGAGRFGPLGVFAALGMAVAAGMVGFVERYRTDRAGPVGSSGLTAA